MKRLLPILGMICTLSSCIYDSPNDNFYRTLWVSEEAPFSEIGQATESGTDGASSTYEQKSSSISGRITLEFLCGGSISVTATGAAGSYGTYQPYGNTAYFAGLTLTYYGEGAAIIYTYRESEEGDIAMVLDDVVSWEEDSVSEHSEGTASGNDASEDDNARKAFDNDSARIIIEEAHRTGDILLVSWHREGSPTSYSTRFIRHSSYE